MQWDIIVIGLGGLGSAVAAELAQRGRGVLGLDQHPPGHAFGSSHGATRAIRKAYFEHPDYVPLLEASYRGWRGLEASSGETLMNLCGVLEVGPADGVVVPGVLRAAAEHGLAVTEFDRAALQRRFGQLGALPPDMVGVLEEEGGFLHVERCVAAQARRAIAAGADFRIGPTVRGYQRTPGGWRVDLGDASVEAARLILCPGAWASSLLPPSLAQQLRVLRKPLLWFAAPAEFAASADFPVWLFETPGGIFYGFGDIDGRGVKAAQHSGGETVGDPASLDRSLRPSDLGPMQRFLQAYLPGIDAAQCIDHRVCMYTMTPDEHFIVGAVPGESGLFVGAGLSGHGFKLVPALAEALTALVCDEPAPLPIELFSPARWAPA